MIQVVPRIGLSAMERLRFLSEPMSNRRLADLLGRLADGSRMFQLVCHAKEFKDFVG